MLSSDTLFPIPLSSFLMSDTGPSWKHNRLLRAYFLIHNDEIAIVNADAASF